MMLQAIERNRVVAIAAAPVAACRETFHGVIDRTKIDDLLIAAREVDLAIGVACRGVVAVLQQHLSRMLAARAALELLIDLLHQRRATGFERRAKQGGLAWGE
ncbi:MAG TPA: hypothetical protein PL196_04560 [Burkholderiaceae bacterium]|nr:hypothetical protein [Burkholderiaceae bacterium]